MIMSSQCIVPNWNLSHQRQEQGEAAAGHEERNRSSSSRPHVHSDHTLAYVVPMANYEVTELTWENGQLALHGLGGSILPQVKQTATSTTTTWEKAGDHTLESIVHQATFPSFSQNQDKNSTTPKSGATPNWVENSGAQMHIDHNQDGNLSSIAASSEGKWRENSGMLAAGHVEQNVATSMSSMGRKWRENFGHMEIVGEQMIGFKLGENPELVNKRVRSEPERVVRSSSAFQAEERASACASASATFCRETDATMMTWNSFESPRSLKSARNGDDDSACHHSNSENQVEERMNNKGESLRRRSRAAAIHNQSERRRRDRINEKMRALQKLVPNASKTDKASMLDEVIEYLKQLQSQVQMMSTARNMSMPQMVMPAAAAHLGMQQQQQQQQLQQMSLLAARMGVGIGMGMGVPGVPMGMLDVNNLARNLPHSHPSLIHGSNTASSFVPPPFSMPPIVPRPNVGDHHASISNLNEAYHSFLAQQSMNMDFFNKMAALCRQQASHQTSKKPVTLSQPNNPQQE